MQLTALCRGLLVAGCSLWVTNAKKCGSGQDLAADGTLRIGIMRKKNCTRKSTGGDQLVMHYTGVLFKDCQEFDSSRDREPFTFTIGVGEVIRGWDEGKLFASFISEYSTRAQLGLLGMCEGDRRRLTIPSDIAYGERGAGSDIPPGATLVFDVELLKIVD
ncbi:unnamed protein product [Ectocarpus sp. 12 AP-2014]